MEQKRTDQTCPLWGTETCARLNMRACRECPAQGKDPREANDIRSDVETLYSFLPEEGIHPLFAGTECTLCKGEEKGRIESYALFDMGHADPRQRKKKLSLFRNKTYGFVVPLQFGCCKNCRRRYQLLSWAPMLTAILILGLALLVVSRETLAQSMRDVWRGLPLLVLLMAGGVSFLLGKLLQRNLRARFNAFTYMDLNDHPAVKRMSSLGWEGLTEGKYPQPVFTRKRLTYGVGTAVPVEQEEKTEGNGEIVD